MHSITALSRMTGLNPSTVRTWERRYGVPQPDRAANGRRVYSEEEVDRLIVISRLVDGGHAIGALVDLSRGQLNQLLDRDPPRTEKSGASALRERAIAAAASGDIEGYRLIAGEALAALPPATVAEHVIAPTLRAVGEMWARGALTVAVEHAITAVTKQLLFATAGATGWRARGHRIAFAALEGELHEMGALLAYYIASAAGHTCTYFGPNLPAHEIPRAAAVCDAEIIVIGVVYTPEPWRTANAIAQLAVETPDPVRIWVGGPLDDALLPAAVKARVTCFASLERFALSLSAGRF